MKNIIKNSLVLVVLFSTFLASANSSLKIYHDEVKTTLTLSDVKLGSELFVKDTYGSVLYSETIKSSGNYTKSFDLTELPDGSYFFEIDKDLEINIIHFTVKEAIVAFDEENKTSIFKPFVKSEENKVSITKLSLDKKPLEINIYFESNGSELIYSETIKNTQHIARTYSLDNANKGTYRIVTKTEGKTFVDLVEL